MTVFRHPALLCLVAFLAACTGGDEKTVDSADGELDVPRRKGPPYQVAPVTAAGRITGTVAGAAPVAAAADGPCAGRAAPGGPVVVYLEDIPRGRSQPADVARRYELAVAECALAPAVTIAAAGGTLNLSNELNTVHHVAFVFDGMKNPMVRVPFSDPGQVVPSEKVLEIPGLVEVRSDLDPAVRARIVVVEHPYAVEAAEGKFTLDSVPPGTYTLVAVGVNGRAQSRVQVTAGKDTPVTLQLQ